jgi:hypothetical protein
VGDYLEEAEAWRDWLMRAVIDDPSDMQIMYAVDSSRDLPEHTRIERLQQLGVEPGGLHRTEHRSGGARPQGVAVGGWPDPCQANRGVAQF